MLSIPLLDILFAKLITFNNRQEIGLICILLNRDLLHNLLTNFKYSIIMVFVEWNAFLDRSGRLMVYHWWSVFLEDDQYELIARAPSNQLRSFTIYCSPCKQSITTHSAKARQVDDDETLRHITKSSLTERMNTLIEGCKAFSYEPIPGPSVHLSFASSRPNDSKGVEHSAAAITSSQECVGADPHLPQVDGLNDSPTESTLSSYAPALSADSAACDLKTASKSTRKAIRGVPPSSWLVHSNLQPPPMYAGWLVERLNTEHWITPVSLPC